MLLIHISTANLSIEKLQTPTFRLDETKKTIPKGCHLFNPESRENFFIDIRANDSNDTPLVYHNDEPMDEDAFKKAADQFTEATLIIDVLSRTTGPLSPDTVY